MTDTLKSKSPEPTEAADADLALFNGQIQGLVATFRSGERPLTGLAGLLDWRFQGAISQCLKQGALTGNEGECVYFPVTRRGTTYHLILAGIGSQAKGAGPLPAETLRVLKKNLASLKIANIGFSRSDLGGVSDDYFSKNLKGIPVCVLR